MPDFLQGPEGYMCQQEPSNDLHFGACFLSLRYMISPPHPTMSFKTPRLPRGDLGLLPIRLWQGWGLGSRGKGATGPICLVAPPHPHPRAIHLEGVCWCLPSQKTRSKKEGLVLETNKQKKSKTRVLTFGKVFPPPNARRGSVNTNFPWALLCGGKA